MHLDMEHDEAKDLTLELLRTLGAEFPDGPQLGCVIQAYRKDAFADLREVVAWSEQALRLPLAVRLVKGAYWDSEVVVARGEGWPVPVFERKAETDASYERCTRYLVERAGHDLLLKTWLGVNPLNWRFTTYTRLLNPDPVELAERHRSLIDAYRSGDQVMAAAAIRTHIWDVAERVLANIPEDPAAVNGIDGGRVNGAGHNQRRVA